jgi:hypothetical protein
VFHFLLISGVFPNFLRAPQRLGRFMNRYRRIAGDLWFLVGLGQNPPVPALMPRDGCYTLQPA